MQRKKMYTTASLFTVIWNILKEKSLVPEHIDYALPASDPIEIRDYAFDILGCVDYGGSEGIYVDLFCRGNIGYPDRKKNEIGTIKTLRDDDDAFRDMAVLMANFQIEASRFVNTHIDDFTWQGYGIDFYREGDDTPACGGMTTLSTELEDAVHAAVMNLSAINERIGDGKPWTHAVLTQNSTGEQYKIRPDGHYVRLLTENGWGD